MTAQGSLIRINCHPISHLKSCRLCCPRTFVRVCVFVECSWNLRQIMIRVFLPYRSRISPVTYRLKAGQSLLLGAFARIDFLEGRPFFFTSVVSPRVSVRLFFFFLFRFVFIFHQNRFFSPGRCFSQIHVTDQNKVSEIWPRHAGNRESKFLVPPYTPERVAQVGLTPGSFFFSFFHFFSSKVCNINVLFFPPKQNRLRIRWTYKAEDGKKRLQMSCFRVSGGSG